MAKSVSWRLYGNTSSKEYLPLVLASSISESPREDSPTTDTSLSEHAETEACLFEQTGHHNFRCEIFPLPDEAFVYARNEYWLDGDVIGSYVDLRL